MNVELIKIFEQLKNTNSIKDKENILKLNENDEELKFLLEYNLNPYKLFQFNKMPCEFEDFNNSEWSTKENHEAFKALLVDLESRLTTGNAAKKTVCAVFKLFDSGYFDLYSKILLKGPIGVGTSTVNKVWPGLIPEFKLMLAPNDLPNIVNVNYPCVVQPKLDGYRCVMKSGKLWSRTGKPFSNKNLDLYFDKILGVNSVVLDGELYCHSISFQRLTSVLNSEDGVLPKDLKYHVYDCVPTGDWVKGETSMVYSNRLVKAREVINNASDYSRVIDIASDTCNTPAEVLSLYKAYLTKGYEGVMLKDPNGLYKWKRVTVKSGEILKLKPFLSADLEITSIYEGENGFKGMAGGVVVDYVGNSVSVGSGFDVVTRKKMAATPNIYVGKIIEVKYFEETEDGSLRFPTFVRFREDK